MAIDDDFFGDLAYPILFAVLSVIVIFFKRRVNREENEVVQNNYNV